MKYQEADKYIIINTGDTIVHPICIKLPKPPPLKLIDGYGLPPEEQYFKRIGNLPRLADLEKRALEDIKTRPDRSGHFTITGYKIHSRFWEILSNEPERYEKEIEFIKQMWWYLVYGYWFFNDGKPTWIPPQHFWYLNYMYISNTDQNVIEAHYPNYRDPDRIDAIFDWYAYTTNETFEHLDDKGNALKVNGQYHMKKCDTRMCFGVVSPKRRRSGESMKGIVWVRMIAGLTFGATCTITSDSEKNAEDKLYDKMLIPSWKKEPLWLRPISDVNQKAGGGLLFKTPQNVYDIEALDSVIMLGTSAENASDGARLNCKMSDEEGKQKTKDVYEKWEIDKKTMCQGQNIHGFSFHPSTVEEMNEGGEAFERLFKESNFYIRIPGIGQTVSGCYRRFRKAFENFDGYFDRHGYAVIERPTARQIKYAPKGAKYVKDKIGAKEYVLYMRKYLEKQGTNEALNKLRKIIRKDPIDSTECFLGNSGDIGFNIQKLDKRIPELRHKTETRKGNFERTNGLGSSVIWVPNEANGRWDCSLVLNPEETNLMISEEIYSLKHKKYIKAWRPLYPNKYIATADSFEYSNTDINKETGARGSDGGGCVFMRRLPTDISLNISEWVGFKFVCTYRYRPSTVEEYCEDMLKMSQYYGAMMYFERNKTKIWEYFIDNGYGNFLGYLMDSNGKIADKPGYYLQDKTEIIDVLRDYIELKGDVENHLQFLEEARAIGAPNQLTKYDLLAACGGALISNKSIYGDVIAQEQNENDINIQDFDGWLDLNTY